MNFVKSTKRLREERGKMGKKPVVFVPTMGALHRGHRALIREARKRAGKGGKVVVSIFVNPTQFDRKEDLSSYPQTLDLDLEICEEDGVDLVFCPNSDEMYTSDASIKVTESSLSHTLCGAKRKGHFDGVCTVVLKLYNLVQPDAMVFGEKDFQQLAIIRRLMRDLDVPVEIIGVSTQRESSGLALSSRNSRLGARALKEAPAIYATLLEMKSRLESCKLEREECEAFFTDVMGKLKTATKIDYVELVDAESLASVTSSDTSRATLAVAIYFGKVRLIDHISVDLSCS